MPRAVSIMWTVAGGSALLLVLTGHGPHLIGYLPYLLLFACPLMHMFMHGGHRHGESFGANKGKSGEL